MGVTSEKGGGAKNKTSVPDLVGNGAERKHCN
jgi:hypothetical protein